jgi:hypothetical protein
VAKDLPKYTALSELATNNCKVPYEYPLNYEKLKNPTSANFGPSAKCINDQIPLANNPSVRTALSIEEWKEDQLKKKFDVEKFQTKFKGSDSSCNELCQAYVIKISLNKIYLFQKSIVCDTFIH